MKLLTILISLMTQIAFAEVHVGKPAHDFSLTGHDGNVYSLAALKGKVVVLEWYNEGCPFVRKHYDSKNMQTLQNEFKDQVVWLSINSSTTGKQGHLALANAKEIYIKEKMSSKTLLLDGEKGTVGKLYGAAVTPHLFIIDRKGDLAYNGAIDSIASTNIEDIAKAEPLAKNAINAVLSNTKVVAAKNKPYGCSVKY